MKLCLVFHATAEIVSTTKTAVAVLKQSRLARSRHKALQKPFAKAMRLRGQATALFATVTTQTIVLAKTQALSVQPRSASTTAVVSVLPKA